MFCTKCGAGVPSTANFCGKCGAVVTQGDSSRIEPAFVSGGPATSRPAPPIADSSAAADGSMASKHELYELAIGDRNRDYYLPRFMKLEC